MRARVYLTETEVREACKAYGIKKYKHLIKDKETVDVDCVSGMASYHFTYDSKIKMK